MLLLVGVGVFRADKRAAGCMGASGCGLGGSIGCSGGVAGLSAQCAFDP